MNRINRNKTTLSAVVLFATCALPAQAAISILGPPTTGTGAGSAGAKTIQAGFSISTGVSKLVVVIGGEHGFSGSTGGNFNSMTFGGVDMVLAAHEGSGFATVGIFYLDNPSGTGDIVVNQENHNSSPYAIFQLTESAPGHRGFGEAAGSTVTLNQTPLGDSLVLVGIDNSGPGGGNFPAVLTGDSPLTDVADRVGNTRWNTIDVATATGGGTAYSFSGANPTDGLAIVGVEFTNVPEPSAFALFGLGGLLLIRKRCR